MLPLVLTAVYSLCISVSCHRRVHTSARLTCRPRLPCIAVICSTHLLPLRNPPNLMLDDCRDSLTRHSHCLLWSTWRRPHPTRRRGSCPLLLRQPLRWHVEQTYVQVPVPLPRTNTSQYAYSAWAPQFADKLQLSATQSNVIVRPPRPASNATILPSLGNSSEHGHVRLGHTSWSHNR